ncbi:DUF3347 domain-containing protein [Chitinophaga polysaccharea]|uniref:DUF3347 domain-containing protein n=1 Tax=Chitinophaga polysaccharea TaxID=1293035 RepID=UPI001454F309|nr:DUF3347 domain-containing protein [Chitinophaga polysaccharea]NLR60325.1 DUF3347 domain-containing protein [Chitinophaga polysaccharea]
MLFKISLPVLAAIFFTACNHNGNEQPIGSKAPEQASIPAPAKGLQIKDDKLHALFQQYEQLTAALVKGDMTAAKIAANAIQVGAEQVNNGHGVADAARKITTAADVDAQRNSFVALSKDMITLVKQSGLKSGVLYVDFCPMAQQDKGAHWLTRNKAIENPYFGEQMLTCGSVQETLQ